MSDAISRRRFCAATIAAGAAPAIAAAAAGDPQGAAVPSQGIIDVHSHPFLESWKKASRQSIASRGGDSAALTIEGSPAPDWSVNGTLELMDKMGIAAMILSYPSGVQFLKGKPAIDLARAMNEELAEIIKAHPAQFGAFAVLPLGDTDATLAEIRYALDTLKLEGVCLPTNVDGVYLADERFAPIFAELDRRRAVAFVHPVTPAFFGEIALKFNPALLEFMFDSTRMITAMIYSGMRHRYPNFTIISTHAGGTAPYLAARLAVAAPVPNMGASVPLTPGDVMRDLKTFHFDLTASASPNALASLLQLVPPTQIFMGFDYPLMPVQSILPTQNGLRTYTGFSNEDREAIRYGNALRMFPGLAARRASA